MKKEAYFKLFGLKKFAENKQWLPKDHQKYNTPVSIDATVFGNSTSQKEIVR